MMINPSPRELAEEALAALHEPPMTPHEHFEFLIQQGIIDRNGRVLVAKLFGPDTSRNGDSTQSPSNDVENNGP